MLHKDNELDQLFRDRLRDHASPVRSDLWRRVHIGIGTPARRLNPLRFWRYLGAGASIIIVAVVAAHFIFAPKAPSVDHYSKISATAVIRPDSGTVNQTQAPIRTPNPNDISTPENQATHSKTIRTPSRASNSNYGEFAPINRISPSGTPADLANHPADPKHLHHPITLPTLARIATPPAVTARPPQKSRPAKQQPSTSLSASAPFHRHSISIYGSPDFPSRYYSLSFTGGVRFTFQFNPHWSFTTGIQYSKVNVPQSEVGGGTAPFSFYFRNYDLPLLAGYTTNLGRYNLTLTAGGYFNLYSTASGPTITYAWWPNRNGHSAVIGFDMSRSLADHWAVFIQPYARCLFFNGVTVLPSETVTSGILLGIKYQL